MQQRINLVPQKALAEKIKKIVPVAIISLILFCSLVVFLMGYRVERQNKRLHNNIEKLQARQNSLQAQQMQIGELKGKVKVLGEEEKSLKKMVSQLSDIPLKKQQLSELLLGITQVMPDTVRCERIVLKDNNGEITGKATQYKDLPAFVKNLNNLKQFHSVSLHVLNQSELYNMELMTFTVMFQYSR